MAGSGRLVDTPLADVEVDALLGRVRAGDMDAYGELYSRYSAFAGKVARRVSRRHADDLVSESFRRILVAMQNGGGPTHGFGPYLATVIRSVGAGNALPVEETHVAAVPETPVESPDVDPRVSTAYLSLPQQWQDAIWYTDVEGLKPRQAAPLMGLASANAFSALRKRARAGLRSAYLTQVVDEACNEEVRQALWMMAEGVLDADVVDEVVDRHIDECDRCAAVAWRVAAVRGHRLVVGLGLAPAILVAHGFTPAATILPGSAGAGLWVTLAGSPRRLWHLFVGNTAAVAGGVASVAIAAGVVAASVGTGGDAEPTASPTTAVSTTVPVDEDEPGGPPADEVLSPLGVADPPPAETSAPTSTTTSVPEPTIEPASSTSALASVPVADEPVAPTVPAVSPPTTTPGAPGTAPPTTAPPVPAAVPTAPATSIATAAPTTPAATDPPAPTAPPTIAPPPSSAPVTAPPVTGPPTTEPPVTDPPPTAPPATDPPPPPPPPPTAPPVTDPPPSENCFSVAGGRIVICLPAGVPWPPPWWPPGP